MEKYKFGLKPMIAACALTLTAAFVPMAFGTNEAGAATFAASNVFSAGSGSTISATEGTDSYVQFTLNDGASVYYRHDLALRWFAKDKDTDVVAENYLNLTFSVPSYDFETLTFSFASEEENVTKEGTATNAVVFAQNEQDELTVAVKNGEETKTAVTIMQADDYTIGLSHENFGKYQVDVNGTYIGDFTNVGGYYMEYLSSSSSTPRDPITVTAETKEEATSQKVVLKDINGQSFKLTDGQIVDNAAPVLVLSEKLVSFPLAQKFALSYKVVDVLKDSVTTTRKYHMYKGAGAYGVDEKPEYTELTTSKFSYPMKDGSTKEYVSIYFTVNDGTNTEDVYLDWYVDETFTFNDVEGVNFIPVVRDNAPVQYTCVETDDVNKTSTFTETTAYTEYQEAVLNAAKDLKAGSGAYFYLPSYRALLTDDNTDYKNMTFSIYYKMQDSSAEKTQSSLAYNKLKFEISKEGEYTFCVVATDKLKNDMKVYDEEGKLVTLTSSSVWELDCVPKFSFSVEGKGASIEKPGEQSLGYTETTYNVTHFEIVALEGYDVEYTLYYFDESTYEGVMPTYSDLVEHADEYTAYLVEIKEYDAGVSETDEAWGETDNNFEWKPEALTFVPDKAGYYFVKAEVTDSVFWTEKAVAYQVIDVRNAVDQIQGETYWVQNNIVSIVLFSISAVLAVAIVVTFLVKPAEKTIDEVDPSKLKGRK